MANTTSLSIDISITDEGVLNDNTEYLSPLRTSVGVFVSAYKVNSLSVQTDIPITGNTDDPATDSTWSFDIDTDGWYQFYFVSIPNYSIVVSYQRYDCVFAPATGIVYQSLVDSNVGNAVTDTNFWVVVPDPSLLVEDVETATASNNVEASLYQRVLMPKVDRLYGNKAVKIARECCGDCEVPEHVDEFEIVFSLREGALISETRFEYADGEKMIRRLDEFLS